jgi:dynein heavy chain
MGKDHEEGIEIIKLSSPILMRTLEISVQFGKWVLLEGIDKDLDPSLDPIVMQ